MTRLELITIALRTVGDTSLGTEAIEALNNSLREIEALNRWVFLEASTTYQTENTIQNVAFSASKWPSAALTDYSKGMRIKSVSKPYILTPKSKDALDANKDGSTGLPKEFAIREDTVYFNPTPVTGLIPLLTIEYYKTISIPSADDDVIKTVTGLPDKYLPVLILGVIDKMIKEIQDGRDFSANWEKGLQFMSADNLIYSGEV